MPHMGPGLIRPKWSVIHAVSRIAGMLGLSQWTQRLRAATSATMPRDTFMTFRQTRPRRQVIFTSCLWLLLTAVGTRSRVLISFR